MPKPNHLRKGADFCWQFVCAFCWFVFQSGTLFLASCGVLDLKHAMCCNLSSALVIICSMILSMAFIDFCMMFMDFSIVFIDHCRVFIDFRWCWLILHGFRCFFDLCSSILASLLFSTAFIDFGWLWLISTWFSLISPQMFLMFHDVSMVFLHCSIAFIDFAWLSRAL